jgi:hypothetical protein
MVWVVSLRALPCESLSDHSWPEVDQSIEAYAVILIHTRSAPSPRDRNEKISQTRKHYLVDERINRRHVESYAEVDLHQKTFYQYL